jgi:hypothetical protein
MHLQNLVVILAIGSQSKSLDLDRPTTNEIRIPIIRRPKFPAADVRNADPLLHNLYYNKMHLAKFWPHKPLKLIQHPREIQARHPSTHPTECHGPETPD